MCPSPPLLASSGESPCSSFSTQLTWHLLPPGLRVLGLSPGGFPLQCPVSLGLLVSKSRDVLACPIPILPVDRGWGFL